jgi:hypothetical protein
MKKFLIALFIIAVSGLASAQRLGPGEVCGANETNQWGYCHRDPQICQGGDTLKRVELNQQWMSMCVSSGQQKVATNAKCTQGGQNLQGWCYKQPQSCPTGSGMYKISIYSVQYNMCWNTAKHP